MKEKCKIRMVNSKKSSEFYSDVGVNLQEVVLKNTSEFYAPCGGRGTCGKCKAYVKGKVSELTEIERNKLTVKEIESGIRLLCQVLVFGDTEIKTINQESAYIQIEGLPYKVKIDPLATRKRITLSEVTLKNWSDDTDRVLKSINNNLKFEPSVLSKMSNIITGEKQEIFVTVTDDKFIDISTVNNRRTDYGFAVDIGTTTVVGYLVNLFTGEIEDTISEINAQAPYGADVLSRISYGKENSNGNEILHKKLVDQLSRMLKKIVEKIKIAKEDICCISFAGNTTMMHFLMGLNPFRISVAPFIPITTSSMVCSASDIGIDFYPQCPILLLPSVSAYIGADITAGMLTCSLTDKTKIQLLVDIGTNGEMALSKYGDIVSCSVAAGPAFEGARIRCGVGGIEGAIDSIEFKDGILKVHTLSDKPPIGICGSGLVDAISFLVQYNIIDEGGRFAEFGEWLPEATVLKDSLFTINGEKAFRFAGEIYICQQDIREVQLAKAAVYAGIRTLIEAQNLNYEDIDIVWLAGGFGNKLNKDNAISIGLLPEALLSKIRQAGNTSGIGATMALLSEECRVECSRIKAITKYLELSACPKFNNEFIEAMGFNFK
jgi:uncharacterized 2Fe-2S/4Fe-4S cluster protein (DUF4445 family)